MSSSRGRSEGPRRVLLQECCRRKAGHPVRRSAFGVIESRRVRSIDNVLEGAGDAVEAEDLVAAAVIGEARADEQVVVWSAEGDAGRVG
jgi:hypothetical protein